MFKKIKGFEKYEISKKGEVRNCKTKKKLKYVFNKKGYVQVQLYNSEIKLKRRLVHCLVYIAFKGKIKYTINHKDGVKTNNNLSNLEDITNVENILHYHKTNGKKYKSKFTGVRKKSNGYFRARVTYEGKTYETCKNTEEKAGLWVLEKYKELGVSTRHLRRG